MKPYVGRVKPPQVCKSASPKTLTRPNPNNQKSFLSSSRAVMRLSLSLSAPHRQTHLYLRLLLLLRITPASLPGVFNNNRGHRYSSFPSLSSGVLIAIALSGAGCGYTTLVPVIRVFSRPSGSCFPSSVSQSCIKISPDLGFLRIDSSFFLSFVVRKLLLFPS